MLRQYPALLPYRERYRDSPALHLRITAHLRENSPVCSYDPIHLDNLLAWAVMWEATEGEGLPDSSQPYEMSIPLRCLWRSPEGYPLWASTCLFPVGPSAEDVIYRHKRAQTGLYTAGKGGKFTLQTTRGRWMERRVPVPATVCPAWQADAIGDPAEVARLLEYVSFLGKERGRGWGEVRRWSVEALGEAPSASCLFAPAEKLLRPVPAAAGALLGEEKPSGGLSLIGWTPPQWKPALFSAGWPVGTQKGGQNG